MSEYTKYMDEKKKQIEGKNNADDIEEETSSDEDDIRRHTSDNKTKSSIKKGIDPDVGAYQIDLNHPDSFSLAEEMEKQDRQKNKFTNGMGMGYHLDDDFGEEEMMRDMYGEEEEEDNYEHEKSMENEMRGTGGLSSFNLDIIQERDSELTNSIS